MRIWLWKDRGTWLIDGWTVLRRAVLYYGLLGSDDPGKFVRYE